MNNAKVKASRFKKLFYVLKGSIITLQSSGILSIGSTFFTDSLGAKVVAFSTSGLILVLEGLDRMFQSEVRYNFYNKKWKSLEQLEADLLEKKIKGESIDNIKSKLAQLDDQVSPIECHEFPQVKLHGNGNNVQTLFLNRFNCDSKDIGEIFRAMAFRRTRGYACKKSTTHFVKSVFVKIN